MPAITEWLVFDTSAYINALRQGIQGRVGSSIARHVRRTYLVSVVAAELRAGVRTNAHREAIDRLVRSFTALERTLTPTAADWLAAGDGLAALVQAKPGLRDKARRLWNDALILLAARQVAAEVVTDNVEDFRLLQPHLGGAVTSLVSFVP
jgi:predicted nucleic acid-binding protein